MNQSTKIEEIEDEECFEMIEYVSASHREKLLSDLIDTMRKWFDLESQFMLPMTSTTIKEKLFLGEGSYEITCHIHPNNLTDNRVDDMLSEQPTVNLNPQGFNSIYEKYQPIFPPQKFSFDFLNNEGSDEAANSDKINPIHNWLNCSYFLTLLPLQGHSYSSPLPRTHLATSASTPSFEGIAKSDPRTLKENSLKIKPEIAKLLLSTGSEALRKVDIKNVPLLVPIGLISKQNYEGLVYLNNDSTTLTQLKEYRIRLSDLYIEPLSFNDVKKIVSYYRETCQKYHKDKGFELPVSSKIFISAEYQYSIPNSLDSKWSNDVKAIQNTPTTKVSNGTSKVTSNLGFKDSLHEIILKYPTMKETILKSTEIAEISWGPSCNPLKSFNFTIYFSPREYSPNLELNPKTSKDIAISANFSAFKDDWALLTEFLNKALLAWPEIENNFLFAMDGDDEFLSKRDFSDSIPSPRASWNSYNLEQKNVKNICTNLFTEPEKSRQTSFTEISKLKEGTAAFLSLNLRNSTSVPYQSFLWNMLVNCLTTISSTDRNPQKELRSLLHPLWGEIKKQLRWKWENRDLIPNVNQHPTDTSKLEVDLRFNLVHQKLSMLNYCIEHQIQSQSLNRPSHGIKNTSRQSSLSSGKHTNHTPRQSISSYHSDHLFRHARTESPNYSSLVDMDHSLNRHSLTNSIDIKKSLGSPSLHNVSECPIQASPEIISHPNSYQKSLVDPGAQTVRSYPNLASSHESGRSLFFTSTRDSIQFVNHPYPSFHESSMAAESFVQVHIPSSIDSYTSLSEVIPISTNRNETSPHLNGVLSTTPQPVEFPDKVKSPTLSANKGKIEPKGRLTVFNEDEKLLYHNELLYIPVTQDPGVMTEDMLLDQAQLFERLGTSTQATRRRAQLQCAHLQSDMEAFKAANPLASLEDFVRWHSPRDWIVEEQIDKPSVENSSVCSPQSPSEIEDYKLKGNGKFTSKLKGRLSGRMKSPGNLWQELWEEATPIPITHQKSLFNSIAEGEKALHYLENLSSYELYQSLIPTIFLICYDVLANAIPKSLLDHLPSVQQRMTKVANFISDFNWYSVENDFTALEPLLCEFKATELYLGRTIALLKKLPGLYRLTNQILTNLQENSSTLVKLESDEIDLTLQLIYPNNLNGELSSTVFVPPLARFEPSLAPLTFPDGYPTPTRQEVIVENRYPVQPTSVPGSNYPHHRMYLNINGSQLNLVDLAYLPTTKNPSN